MSTIAIVGTQWGDEGKGKIVDYLAKNSDVVCRWAGGDNAGHTIYLENKKQVLSILPSGVFNANCKNIIGAGCAVNLEVLLTELAVVKKLINCEPNLIISDRAHIVLPYHQKEDQISESFRQGEAKIGTTKKGIGPCYVDKHKRQGILIGDLSTPSYVRQKLWFKFSQTKLSTDSQAAELENTLALFNNVYNKIKPLIKDVSLVLTNLINQDYKVLFEGAQGVMLDVTHGTYPYVTSSHPAATSIPVDLGISPKAVNQIFGVAKAYNSRVGSGVFVTEINNDIANKIRETGNEYGSRTGRPRRIGWLDLVALKYACRISGVNALIITLLDVLTGFKTLKICVGYKLPNGKIIDNVPANYKIYESCEPVFDDIPGWTEDVSKVKNFDNLPHNLQIYIQKIEKYTGVKVNMVSVGPGRDQVIVKNNFNF